MDGEIVDALLGLLDQRVAEHLPGQVLGNAADLLQRLVERHRADRHRRELRMIQSRMLWMLRPVERSITVSAPQRDRPDHLLDLLGHRRGDGRVADIGVDLHQEIAADDHRLAFRVVDVGRDDGAAARHLVAHEFGRDEVGNDSAEAFAVADKRFLSLPRGRGFRGWRRTPSPA
jgi:hypothetical protein